MMLVIIMSIRRTNVKEKYLSTWIGFLLCPIFALIFQEPLRSISVKLGFEIYSNFIFSIALFWLGALIFQILINLSQAEKKIEILTEEYSILKSEFKKRK